MLKDDKSKKQVLSKCWFDLHFFVASWNMALGWWSISLYWLIDWLIDWTVITGRDPKAKPKWQGQREHSVQILQFLHEKWDPEKYGKKNYVPDTKQVLLKHMLN